MKYLKKFDLQTEYDSYIGDNPFLPNVSLVTETDDIFFNPSSGEEPVLNSLYDVTY